MSDDELRQLAQGARSEVEAALDVDEAWTRLHSSRQMPTGRTQLRRRDRRVFIAVAAAAAALVGVVAWSVLPSTDDTLQTVSPATSLPTTPSGPVTVEPSLPEATVESLPAVTDSMPTTPASAPNGNVISLDTSALPADAPLDLLAQIALEEGEPVPQVAVGDQGVLLYRSTRDFVTILKYNREVVNIPIAADEIAGLSNVVYGPGEVMYGLRPTVRDGVMGMRMQAVSLQGERVGQVVAESDELGTVRWVELPSAPFGHGLTGVVARVRNVGSTLIAYVDETGAGREYSGLVPDFFSVDDTLRVTAASGVDWQLDIDGQRQGRSILTGAQGAAPSNGQRAVYVTNLSDSEEVAGANVIAVLESDGTGEWLTVPDGWQYGASDAWGTAFTRLDGNVLKVSLLAGGPVSWQRSGFESARISSACSQDAGCPQLRVDRDGTVVSYDPVTRMLTRHSIPERSAEVPADFGQAYLEVVGPDEVVYLNVDPQSAGEGNADLVAVVIAENGLVEVGRWTDATDRIGDSDLVASPTGLVRIGCCGPDMVRPVPDAAVAVDWVNRSGAQSSPQQPEMRVELDYPQVTIVRTNDVPRTEVSWTVALGEAWAPRGTPLLMPTFDGGFITYFGTGTGSLAVRGWPDGTSEVIDFTDPITAVDPSGRLYFAGDEMFARVDPFEDRAIRWDGRSETLEDGSQTYPGLDEYVVANRPAWASSPVSFANAIAGQPQVNETRTVASVQTSEFSWSVTVTTGNYFDDSVFAGQTLFDLGRGDDGLFRLKSAAASFACQPRRGHQAFSTELCT